MKRKNIFLSIILILAAVTIITAAYVFLFDSHKSDNLLPKKFLSSAFNNIEEYNEIFLELERPLYSTDVDAGIISHHFLAKQLIANFYNKIGNDKISTIFLLSPDHYNNYFKPNTIAYTSRLDWTTPFGEMQADQGALKTLLNSGNIEEKDYVLGLEHGIYVEIPFIKNFFPNAKIVPLVLKSGSDYDIFSNLGKKIKEIGGENSVLIVSSDFSHEVTADNALQNDKKSLGALINPGKATLNQITNDCKQCIATLSGFLTKEDSFYLIDNKNSFDISGQDKNSVTSYVSGYYAKKEHVQILFTGDLMFDRGIRYYAAKNGGNNFIFEKIKAKLFENDLVVANLEGPITDNSSISAGTVPGSFNNYFFTFDPSVAKTLYDNNIKIVSLGNNHILNFNNDGLAQTKKYLNEADVGYFGAPDYPRSITSLMGGLRITFINYNQFSSLGPAAEKKATLDEVKNAKEFSDVIIVYSHWDLEYNPRPSQATTNLAHQFVDAGADLIIGSHPHVIQTTEDYKGRRIYYSLGNFIFDQYFSDEVRDSLGVVLKIDKTTKNLSFEQINFYLATGGQTVIKP